MKTNIAYMLRGCEAGQIQTVGLMQVIPLTSGPEFCSEDIVSPRAATISTRTYGSMGFQNNEAQVMIVPAHASYITKQAAQDHAMARAGVVESKKFRLWNDAMCVQARQCGMIRSGDSSELSILPLPLRFKAHEKRGQQEFGKLWKDIEEFNASMGLERRGHLEDFFVNFTRQLDEFVAEFEIVPNQVGAIILVDDKVVGVERTPNYQFWKDVWPQLIRGCYGSFALQVARKKKSEKSGAQVPLSTRLPLPKDIGSLADLERELLAVIDREAQAVKNIVMSVVQDEMELKSEEPDLAGMSVDTLTNSVFIGQLIRRGQAVVYGSVILQEEERASRVWRGAKSFSM